MKELTRREAIEFLKEKPYKLGHMLGFKDLTVLHNDWLISMRTTKGDMTLQAHRGSYKTTVDSLLISTMMISPTSASG